jgi:hypothetical protein
VDAVVAGVASPAAAAANVFNVIIQPSKRAQETHQHRRCHHLQNDILMQVGVLR